MRRSATLPLLGLGLAAVLAACADGTSPSEPLVPRASITPATSFSCNGSAIKQTLAGLYPTTTFKSFVLPTYNQAEKDQRQGKTLAAQNGFHTIIGDVVLRYRENVLLTPSGYGETSEAVYFVVTSLLRCAEGNTFDITVLNLHEIIPAIAGNLYTPLAGGSRPDSYDDDYQLCPISPTGDPGCAVPSGRAAAYVPTGFVTRRALLLIEPAEGVDGLFTATQGTIWSGRWRMLVANSDAQAYPSNLNAPAGSSAVCSEEQPIGPDPDGFHAPNELLELVRVAETGDNELTPLPATDSDSAVALLTGCEDQTETERVGSASVPAFHDAYAFRRGWFAVQSAGRALGKIVAPKPAYAFDGGIGGSVRNFLSYFAATEKPNVYIRDEPLEQTFGRLTDTTLVSGEVLTVVASRTEFGVTIAPTTTVAGCVWTSSHSRIRIEPLNDRWTRVTLTASNSAGIASVSVVCDGVPSSTPATITVVRAR